MTYVESTGSVRPSFNSMKCPCNARTRLRNKSITNIYPALAELEASPKLAIFTHMHSMIYEARFNISQSYTSLCITRFYSTIETASGYVIVAANKTHIPAFLRLISDSAFTIHKDPPTIETYKTVRPVIELDT